VSLAISDYNTSNLEKFNGVLMPSRLTRAIDDSDTSVISNITVLKMIKSVVPNYNVADNYTVTFKNSIETHGTAEQYILSNGFYLESSSTKYYIDDDGLGNLRLFHYDPATYLKVFSTTFSGTVNYTTGLLTINNLKITALVDAEWIFTVVPKPENFISSLNQIVQIDPAYTTITMVQQ
jgi:hypothetical protein